MNTSSIAVIGGTGKAGKYLVKALIQNNYTIKMLHRHPELLEHHPNITYIQGDARDPEAILELADGCTILLNMLGQPKGEPSIFLQATENVIAALKDKPGHHYIVITGLNVDTPQDKKGPETEQGTAWMYANYPKTTMDKQREYDTLVESGMDFTMFRLPLIVETDELGEVVSSLEDCPSKSIRAADLARFVIQEMEQRKFVGSAPFLGSI